MGFYGSNDPTNSIKALKDDVQSGIRLQSHQVHLTMLQQYNTYSVWQDKQKTRNLGTVKWVQWDNPIQRTVSVLMTVHNTEQNSYDNLPSYLKITVIDHAVCWRSVM